MPWNGTIILALGRSTSESASGSRNHEAARRRSIRPSSARKGDACSRPDGSARVPVRRVPALDELRHSERLAVGRSEHVAGTPRAAAPLPMTQHVALPTRFYARSGIEDDSTWMSNPLSLSR
jgi:hypothetical protein